ncbi:hypothetical protein L1049_023536 [Liquidambar formosana]|uniref:Uncharacterized protein n=1 Tax=Liquidambar formosana TaxID=63359 RepID=A0AAP0X448_LIQFO
MTYEISSFFEGANCRIYITIAEGSISSWNGFAASLWARLKRAFRGASFADFVWESLLSDYQFLIDKLFSGFPENFVNKQIYAWLCRPNSFDGSTKKAWLDKTTGGVCLSIAAKGLAITGIDDPVDLLLLLGLAFNRFGRHLGRGGG